MPDNYVFQPSVDLSKLAPGLAQMEAMVDARFKAIQAKAMATTGGKGMFSAFVGGGAALQSVEHQMNRTSMAAAGLGRSIDRIAGTFNSGLGIGIAVGGLALLERSFSKAIEKAREFQTAQLAIAATLQSSYRLVGKSGDIGGGAAFGRMQAEAGVINQQIIKRQAQNILTYQEQLSAFQSSLNAGARKGLTPTNVMDVSEQLAIVAKTLGLRGEEIANASRIGLGGAVNVSRSTIGRALGITNEDISKRSGDDLQKFLMGKTKGFQAGAPSFAKSIEGVTSTLEAQIDVFMAKVGQKFMKNATPLIQQFGSALEGQGSEKFADTLTSVFKGILNAIEAIGKSPVIPMLVKFLEMIANYGDKILLAGIFAKITMSVMGAVAGLRSFLTTLQQVAVEAGTAAPRIGAVAVAEGAVGTAGMMGAGGMSRGAYPGGAGRAAYTGQQMFDLAAISGTRKGRNLVQGRAVGILGAFDWEKPGSGGYTNLRQYPGQYEAARLQHASEMEKMQADIRQSSMRRATRDAGNNAYDEFAQTAAFTGNAPKSRFEAEAGINAVQTEQRAARFAVLRQRAGKLGAIGLQGVMRGIGPAALGYMGGEVIRSQTDQGSDSMQGVGAGLQGGLTVGAGLLGAGVPAPVAVPIAASVGLLVGFNAALQAAAEGARKAQEAFDAFAEEHPNAVAASALSQRMGRVSRYGQEGLLSPDVTKKIRDNLAVSRQEQREAGSAVIMKQESTKVAEAAAQAASNKMQALSLGYGGANAVRRIQQESELKGAQTDFAAGKGELAPSNADKIIAAKTFAQYEAMRDALRKRQIAAISAGKKMPAMPDWLNKFQTLEDVEQYFAAASQKGEIRSELQDKMAMRELKRKQSLAGLGRGIEAQQKAAGFGFEQQLIGQKGEFDTIGAYGAYSRQARAAFQQQQATEFRINKLGKAGELAGAFGDTENQQRLATLADIEGKRDLMGGDIGRYAGMRFQRLGEQMGIDREKRNLGNVRSDIQFQRMQEDFGPGLQGLKIQAQQAVMGREQAGLNVQKAGLASTLEGPVGPYGAAQSAIRYKVESEMARFDPSEYEAAYKESLAIKQKETEMAKKMAGLEEQLAVQHEERAKIAIVRFEQDYALSIQEYTISIKERNLISRNSAEAEQAFAKALWEFIGTLKNKSAALAAMPSSVDAYRAEKRS